MSPDRAALARLFALSFLTLFLELMLIRWVPGVVRLVAYYANLLLISSFLGLGVGALLARRAPRLFGLFPLLFLADVALLLFIRDHALPGSPLEYRFFTANTGFGSWVVLVAIFLANTAIFVPLGVEIGRMFERLPTLRAYSWDLAGSLAGTIAFGLFAYFTFSPVLGAAGVVLLYLVLIRRERRWLLFAVPLLLGAVALMRPSADSRPIWSPYYHVTVANLTDPAATEPPPVAELRTMSDPPVYSVRVNQDFYQFDGTFDVRRYTQANPDYRNIAENAAFYRLPFQLHPAPRDVLVIGSGGGPDVEAALLSGAERVDAVEIDPVLVSLSRRLNASGVYDDARVTVHTDDARAFLHRADGSYDMVAFAFLDSQGLSSAMASIRLDSYVYTVESIREAFRLLDEDGVLTLSFASDRVWVPEKLAVMLEQGTGRRVATFMNPGGRWIFAVAKDSTTTLAARPGLQPIALEGRTLRPPTDDWPYLYLAYPAIPGDYLFVIGSLFALSIALLFLLTRGPHGGAPGWEFGFLGAGFLLLQTKSVVDCALYFGATWLVTTVVICGVLLMVFVANLVAARIGAFRYAFYLPLLLSLVVLYLTPRDFVLQFPLAGRLAWTLLVIPLPIFFAGLVFSTRFRLAPHAAAAFGANLMGAMAGGFLEYLGMIVGSRQLMLLVIALYAASLIAIRRAAPPPVDDPVLAHP